MKNQMLAETACASFVFDLTYTIGLLYDCSTAVTV